MEAPQKFWDPFICADIEVSDINLGLLAVTAVCNDLKVLKRNGYKLAQVVSLAQGDETVNFGGQEVTGQGHAMLKLHLEAWRRMRYSQPIHFRFSICDLFWPRDLDLSPLDPKVDRFTPLLCASGIGPLTWWTNHRPSVL